MSDDKDFEKLTRSLQKKIEHEEEKDYSKNVIKEYRTPSNFGSIKNPDASGKIKGPCGDTMKIDLKIKDDKISDIHFSTDGCGASIACGSMLSKMVIGKTIQEAYSITCKELIGELDGLSAEHNHCIVLAISTLQNAIKNYNRN